ncbi:hypothetical protein BGZ73_001123, partial [Actinomortierella ambigua]
KKVPAPPGDEIARKAIDLHEKATGANINTDKSSVIPLTPESADNITLPGFRVL